MSDSAVAIRSCLTILHVEDCAADAALLRALLPEALSDRPHRIVQVSSLGEAEKAIAEGGAFCLALLDLHLPDGHGLAVVRHMRARLPDATLVVMTGNSDEDLALSSLGEGAQDFLVKDEIMPSTLRRALLRATQRDAHLRSARHELRRVREQSMLDPLTRLPNRLLFVDRLQMAEARANREDSGFAVAWFDLNGFKRLNDEFGHDWGDRALVAFGRALRASAREGDTVARFGGDEFVALLSPIRSPGEAQDTVARMQAATHSLLLPAPCSRYLSASAGFACWPQHSRDPDELLRLADLAMLAGKKRGVSVAAASAAPAGNDGPTRLPPMAAGLRASL